MINEPDLPYALTVKELKARLSSLPDHYVVFVVRHDGVKHQARLENVCGLAINGEGVQLHAESFQIVLDAGDDNAP